MDNARKNLDLSGLVRKLRSVTLAVQIMPFAYGLFFIISLFLYFSDHTELSRICDTLFYTSPFVVAEFLILSKMLRLCRWHKTACCIPLVPQCVALLDYYIIELSEVAATVNALICIGSTILLLIAAYNVFFK